jgi:hypothetical protein
LLDPLGLKDLVQGIQLGPELCCEGLPLAQGLLPLGQLLFPSGRLQLPGEHLLEVPFVLFAVPHEFGPLRGELAGRRLGALLQLGALVAEELVLRFQRLPFSPDGCLGFIEDLVGARQHPGKGVGAAFGSAPNRSRRPKITSISSRAGGGTELDAPPRSPSVSGAGVGPLAGTSFAAAAPPDAGAATAGPPVGMWEASGAVPTVAGCAPLTPISADSCC